MKLDAKSTIETGKALSLPVVTLPTAVRCITYSNYKGEPLCNMEFYVCCRLQRC